MAEKTALTDLKNVEMAEVPRREGMSVESAYRHLASAPKLPVKIEQQQTK